jgi:hypothetical protein
MLQDPHVNIVPCRARLHYTAQNPVRQWKFTMTATADVLTEFDCARSVLDQKGYVPPCENDRYSFACRLALGPTIRRSF